ncbi:ketoacyl-synt-domain-containing protein [Annulohypoxylon maeteangense]|uniref:ketoacyl-synt-domain-containing protein n=1 Tax=Annulohypoxylon maeteangense TaxID=1927788 RepID=UPI0020078E7C|nr:ketoacyl-synt-domain-containing protein [Annulohypoxylon maeteangense]KAI0884084.1 ketoacyl-synt-domain-containing protein [Annulohypoxylon maeteangense]
MTQFSASPRRHTREFVVALFGPQATHWTQDSLASLQSDLLQNSNLEFLVKSLLELPSLWALLEQDYGSEGFHGADSLKELHDFATGEKGLDSKSLTNTHLAPLTVVSHVIDFIRSIENPGTQESLSDFEAAQGFCIGFLSAAALSSANDWSDFERNVSNAIRLAACIGAVVDAEEASHVAQDRATAISIHWKTAADRTYLETCLDSIPEAYISCITDDKSLTVTLPKGSEEAFCARLRESRIATTSVGLDGCYHHSRHIEAANKLVKLCNANSDLRLPDAGSLRLPLRSTADGSIIKTGALHEIAIQLILCKRAHWFQTVKLTLGDLIPDKATFVSLGTKSCIPRSLSTSKYNHDDGNAIEEIAVVGMACRFPQADTLEEFWEIIQAGKTALSTMPLERFNPAEIAREPKLTEYWGNFLRRPDAFDHRFFGISGREAKSMDPQQRLALQVAYEALESSGYCVKETSSRVTDIGCYLGVGSVDYEDNIESENANAFAATGMLRAFISGRISHFYGWTGPSITFDTACSSSAVAIHTACKALLGGECSMALAGGVNVITSPTLHQNLAGASFLNSNGSSRAFDTMAGGYCRGEGAGILVLKPLSRAVVDGDTVLGVIAASAVNQGSNCSPITVPDSRSQSSLYERVLTTARIKPADVTYVEAHGTGTPVGDPIEYESVRMHKMIPKQANFVSLNPRIKASSSNRIIVPKATQPWTSQKHVALVNNYGAAGSNAAMLIRAHSEGPLDSTSGIKDQASSTVYPILISAKSSSNLQLYVDALKAYLPRTEASLGSIAYNIARSHNSAFDNRIAFTASDMQGLLSGLDSFTTSGSMVTRTNKYPVVLCFGGQTGRNVTISKDLYDNCDIFRNNLSWIDSGLEVDTVIGHSFGQLTALCIAGSISLEDTFRLISGRARIIRDSWNTESGAMLSVECDKAEIEAVVQRLNAMDDYRVDIACYNGPRSFVLAGDTRSIDRVEEECSSFKKTRLQNTHAYHSYVADGILSDLRGLAESISIRTPRIHVETCSAGGNWSLFTADEVVKHTRQPVYFADAIERISARLPSAIWLEAGSASPIVPMARRIIPKADRSDIFIPTELGSVGATANLANATCQLWKAGSATQHWAFHQSPSSRYMRINLPPYQFDKTSHWIEYKPRTKVGVSENPNATSKASGLVSILKSGAKGEHLFSVDTSNVIFQLAGQGHAVTGQSLCPASMYVELAVRCATMLLDTVYATNAIPHVEGLTMSAPLGLGAGIPVFMRLRNVARGSWNFALFSRSSMHGDAGGNETEHAQGVISYIPVDDAVAESRLKLLRRLARSSGTDRIRKLPSATGVSGAMVYKLFSDVVEYASYYRGVQNLSAVDNEAVGLVTVPTDQPLGMDAGICDPISLDNFLQVAGIHVNCLSPRKDDEVFMCTAVEEVIFSASFMSNRVHSRSWTVYTRYEATSNSVIANDIFVCDAASKELVVAIMGATFRSVPFRSLSRSLSRLNNKSAPNTNIILGPTAISPQISDSDSDDADSEYQKGYTPLTEYEEEKLPAKHGYFSHTQSSLASNLQSLGIQQSVEEVTQTPDIVRQVREMFSAIIEIPVEEIEPSSSLDDLGIDSLLVTEVLVEIQSRFQVKITQAQFQECTDVLDVARFIQPVEKTIKSQPPVEKPGVKHNTAEKLLNSISDSVSQYDADKIGENLAIASRECFVEAKPSYDQHAETTGFKNFNTDVFPLQSELVVQYVLAAFASLGCVVPDLNPRDEVPMIRFDPKHNKVVPQLYKILEDAGLLKKGQDGVLRRTEKSIQMVPTLPLHEQMLKLFPKHTSETKLLYATAHKLADCLTGAADPISLIFGTSDARALLADVYTNAPMFKTGTLLLSQYLTSVLKRFKGGRELRILELGAGTGGTTKDVVEKLAALGPEYKFSYTFTDLSSSLVAAARRKFAKWPFMRYTVVDIEKDPNPQFLGAYDIIISTNCIHATKSLVNSTTNIRKMLSPDGILCLVELTRNLFWFDLVFGLLEGWWLFSDGRKHALARETLWEKELNAAGFNWVDWSDTPASESHILKVITASPYAVDAKTTGGLPNGGLPLRETVAFKQVDGVELQADIYYPPEVVDSGRTLPVVTLPNGPMSDAADALLWIRTVLPKLTLSRRDVHIDAERVVAVGWSSGGHLAMSLAWTSLAREIKPPSAILAFYSPSDYEDSFWIEPNVPAGSRVMNGATSYELDDQVWTGISDHAIVGYNPPPTKRALGGWLAPTDPRSRLALYMNWHGRTLHTILGGLDKNNRIEPQIPATELIKAVSPLAQARAGRYTTPTFLIHPREDDLVPWQQAERTWQALQATGTEAQLRIVEDVPHLFDLYPEHQSNEFLAGIVAEGYEFLCQHVGLSD